MVQCAQCGTAKLGLIRHTLLTFGGYLNLCSHKCRNDYCNHLRQEVRKRKFFDWLHNENTTG